MTIATASPEANPDTNGSLVVYDSVRGSNPDLFWRPVGGGTEVQLEMPGVEANPSIAGNFIAFESRPTLVATSDIYVYDLAANRLYQITNTPLVTEQLNDINVLPDGMIRTVWTGDEDGFSATSTAPRFRCLITRRQSSPRASAGRSAATTGM
ncbi:MAG: TolB family protein [Gammaproteobacteria bacterium]